MNPEIPPYCDSWEMIFIEMKIKKMFDDSSLKQLKSALYEVAWRKEVERLKILWTSQTFNQSAETDSKLSHAVEMVEAWRKWGEA